MPSPFPGMNPYFEQSAIWHDFHIEFITVLRRELARTVGPTYIVQLEEHIYIHDISLEQRRMLVRADLSVAEPRLTTARPASAGLMDAPAEVLLPDQDVERIPFLEVRDRLGRELVTVVELLSPSTKRPGEDRELYLAKRRALLRSPTHLVEIDLLRGGPRMPLRNGSEAYDYAVLVSRAERRPSAAFWRIHLRDPLPKIPVPLREPEEDACINLQEVLHHSYDGPGYEHFIYDRPPDPPPSAEDAAWAEQFVPKR